MTRMANLWPVLLCVAGPALGQGVGEPGSTDLPAYEDTRLDETLKDAERDAAGSQVAPREARLALESYGRCTAQREPGEAARILVMDFTKVTYRTGLRMLNEEAERRCARPAVGVGGAMRSSNLLFAGEVAEALLESDPAPLRGRLAKAASGSAGGFTPIDNAALCVSRSVPDQVAALFATERESAEEKAAIDGLGTPLQMCARAVGIARPLAISPAGLRAMLATASYRLIAGKAS